MKADSGTQLESRADERSTSRRMVRPAPFSSEGKDDVENEGRKEKEFLAETQ